MTHPSQLYRTPLALLTDLYQLTMAYAAFRTGAAEREAVFHMFFRRAPYQGGYAIACGVEDALDFISQFKLGDGDLAYLGSLTGADDKPLFAADFLAYLAAADFRVDVDAVPEGTAVFPHEPLVRVRGPVIPCMLFETPLLNAVNFQTLVATKAARVSLAARGEPVLEFGLRRAQGIDGALAASRAAYIGGCAATSNVLAGKLYGIPVRGTHAHSWIMLFGDELEAFDTYARALPNNCVFLVDTYDTLQGVRHAIEIGRKLRAGGHELGGVRLDSGDLAYLSIEARRLLDEAGFPKAVILASNDLDEHLIETLKQQGAKIGAWGVGTRLITGHPDGALGGVYKMSVARKPGGAWDYRVKLSEQAAKISTPGILQVRRFAKNGLLTEDVIYDELRGMGDGTLVDPEDPTRRRRPIGDAAGELLVPVIRAGARVAQPEPLDAARVRTQGELARLHAGIKRLVNPHRYPVGLEGGLHDLRTGLILQQRGLAA